MTPHLKGPALLGIAAVFSALPALAQEMPPAGALACGGCHPATVQGTVVPLHGLTAAQILDAMQAFRSGARPATVMDRIAKGFSEEELAAIAAFYAKGSKP